VVDIRSSEIATKLCKRPTAKAHHNLRSSIITMPRTRRQQAAAAAHTKEMPPVSKKNLPKSKAAAKAAAKAAPKAVTKAAAAAKAVPKAAPKDCIDLTLADAPSPEKAHCASIAFPISSLDADKNQKRVTIKEHPHPDAAFCNEKAMGYVAMLTSLTNVGLPKQGNVCKGKCNC
jgi:hypothetical protein